MNNKSFVKAIKESVRESAVTSTINNLTKPAGRRPLQENLDLSLWYNGLTESDKTMLKKAILRAVDHSVFGFLAVLDGVHAIEDSPEKGKFELFYEKNSISKLLNSEEDEYLHDIYKQLISDDKN